MVRKGLPGPGSRPRPGNARSGPATSRGTDFHAPLPSRSGQRADPEAAPGVARRFYRSQGLAAENHE